MYLFASDFDGTLKQNGVVSKRTLQEIERFRKAGHLFGIVTGRNLEMIAPEIKLYQIPLDFLIGANGGIIKVDNEIISHSVMKFEIAQQILQIAKEKKMGTIGLSDGYRYGNICAKPEFSIKKIAKFFAFLTQRHNSKTVLAKQQITAIFIHDKPAKIQEMYLAIKDIEGIEAYINNYEYLDIVAEGVSKANGVSIVANYFDVTKSYVIGDSLNDLSMIEEFNGFCVENACTEVKDKAKHCFNEVGDALEYIMEVEKNETK